jgi:hypothetical protein
VSIRAGQGLFLQIPFADGTDCKYHRPFLVIDVDQLQNRIKLLNVSSVRGKAHKVGFSSNKLLINYKPPFIMPSFVKLDSLYIIEYFPDIQRSVLDGGQTLDSVELQDIIREHYLYSQLNMTHSVFYTEQDIRQYDSAFV